MSQHKLQKAFVGAAHWSLHFQNYPNAILGGGVDFEEGEVTFILSEDYFFSHFGDMDDVQVTVMYTDEGPNSIVYYRHLGDGVIAECFGDDSRIMFKTSTDKKGVTDGENEQVN